MRNLIIVLAFISILFSCTKEKDITGTNYVVTATTKIWSTSKLQSVNIDSTKFEFFTTSSYGVPFATVYTGSDGTCQIILKGDTEYWMKCTSPNYKNSAGKIYSYNPIYGNFHSTHEKNNKRHTYISADFTNTFIEGQIQGYGGSTINIYDDPINF